MNHSDLPGNFGAAVRRLRFRMGISQEELAGRANLHRTYIAGIERGGRNVTLKSIEKLATALEISAAELLSYGKAPSVETENAAARTAYPGILLIQSDPNEVQRTLQALAHLSIANPIHVAREAAEALDYLHHTGPHLHRAPEAAPALIILDADSSAPSGQELLRRIKSNSLTRQIPVLLIGSAERHRDIAESYRLNSVAYANKPLDFASFAQAAARLRVPCALLQPASPGANPK